MRNILLAALLLTATQAHAANYLIVCSPAACTASDGTSRAAGTALNRIVGNGIAAPPETAIIADDGRALYQPPAPTPTSITALGFIQRWTAAEYAAANAAQPFLVLQLASAGTIEIANPQVTGGMALLVAGGQITAARAAQILNLAVASP